MATSDATIRDGERVPVRVLDGYNVGRLKKQDIRLHPGDILWITAQAVTSSASGCVNLTWLET